MKITKSQLKQIVKEELNTVFEQQSAADIERQAELTAAAASEIAKKKYGAQTYDPDEQIGVTRVDPGQVKMIDLLSDIKGLLQQLVQKP